MISIELKGFGTSMIQRGILRLHPSLCLQKKSTKEGLTGLGYRITGPIGMHVKHVVGLYRMFGHDDFCKMMITCGIQVGDDMNIFFKGWRCNSADTRDAASKSKSVCVNSASTTLGHCHIMVSTHRPVLPAPLGNAINKD